MYYCCCFHDCFAIKEISYIITHSKYFPVSDWLKPHAKFIITSCCSPNLKRIFAILNQWCQKCSPLQIIEPLTEKTWGQGCVIFGERKYKERNGETPLRRMKYFEWVIKQLLNPAFVGYEEFCRSRSVLSTEAEAEMVNTLHDLQNSSYPTQPHSIVAKYSPIFKTALVAKNIWSLHFAQKYTRTFVLRHCLFVEANFLVLRAENVRVQLS